MKEGSYTLDDAQYDIGDLHRLLDTMLGFVDGMPYERDGERDQDLERVNSLLRIACSVSARIKERLDNRDHLQGRSGSAAP